MIILETGEAIHEDEATNIIREIQQILRKHDLSVRAAKYLLDETKNKIENAKV